MSAELIDQYDLRKATHGADAELDATSRPVDVLAEVPDCRFVACKFSGSLSSLGCDGQWPVRTNVGPLFGETQHANIHQVEDPLRLSTRPIVPRSIGHPRWSSIVLPRRKGTTKAERLLLSRLSMPRLATNPIGRGALDAVLGLFDDGKILSSAMDTRVVGGEEEGFERRRARTGEALDLVGPFVDEVATGLLWNGHEV
jgi:hypothetical protein